nr:MAG: ORF1 [Torque teno virus]
MWWGWWKRRWRRPKRRWRTWRRRRPATRRRARAARRPRRRRVRRWRRRRRGWARRIYLRKRKRLKKRKKIILTQWNPAVVKKCVVRGYMPLLICGSGSTGTTHRNYGSHIADNSKIDSFGGGFSTLNFNMSYLYDEYVKHRNTWSRSNVDLELVRYKGCQFKIYRHPSCDFFVRYNRKPPFTDSQITVPSLHPANLINSRKRIILQSFKTKPKGRICKKVKIRPPTLFNDKWYFQKDFCKVPLVQIGASIGNLRFPFCRPQTDNPCITFQVLSGFYNSILGIQNPHVDKAYEYLMTTIERHYQDIHKKGTLGNYTDKGRMGVVFNTFKTEEHIKDPGIVPSTSESAPTNANKYYVSKPYTYETVTSLWGDYVYKPNILTAFKENANKYWNSRKGTQFTASKFLNHKTGLYSPIFLSRQRLSPDFPGFYTEVIYNPQNDKGIGNKIWIDTCVKNDSYWRPNIAGSVPIEDMPLWMALCGYTDYCAKRVNYPGIIKEYRLTIICPYTDPPLTDPTNADAGFIPYDYNFGDGKMPDGEGYIPIAYRFNWYPCIFHQRNVINDIVQSGPFAYGGEEKSAVLTCKYKFTFLFGGNPISQQTIKDPCQQPEWQIPGTGGQPPRLQIENPMLLDEGYYFRAWDIRRGIFGPKAIKRMSTKQITSEFFTGPPKKSKLEVPAIAEDDSTFQERKWSPWSEESQSETEKSENENETPQTTPQLQQQLIRQLQEQKQIKSKLKHLIKQLVKTQHHLQGPIIHW